MGRVAPEPGGLVCRPGEVEDCYRHVAKHRQYQRRRLASHPAGRTCRTTKVDPPVEITLCEPYETMTEPRMRERQVKRWSRAKKEALVRKDLAELRRLSKSTD